MVHADISIISSHTHAYGYNGLINISATERSLVFNRKVCAGKIITLCYAPTQKNPSNIIYIYRERDHNARTPHGLTRLPRQQSVA